jgi:hypothetical protein
MNNDLSSFYAPKDITCCGKVCVKISTEEDGDFLACLVCAYTVYPYRAKFEIKIELNPISELKVE